MRERVGERERERERESVCVLFFQPKEKRNRQGTITNQVFTFKKKKDKRYLGNTTFGLQEEILVMEWYE